jgi:hypothetical protein
MVRVSPAQVTGKKSGGSKTLRTRPVLVYVYDPKDPERYVAPDAHKSWIEWQVVVPGRLFERLRITVERARADPALRAHAKRRQPLFLRPDLIVVHAMSPRTSVKRLYDRMKRTVELDFAPSVDEIWARWQRNREEFWNTKAEAVRVDGLLREAARTRDPEKRKRLSERHRRETARHAARLRALDQEEKTLYELKRKTPQ